MENWILLLPVAMVAYILGWCSGRLTTPGPPSPASHRLAAEHLDLLGEDVSTNARIAAIKRLRVLRPDLKLKEAKDAVEAIAIRRRTGL